MSTKLIGVLGGASWERITSSSSKYYGKVYAYRSQYSGAWILGIYDSKTRPNFGSAVYVTDAPE